MLFNTLRPRQNERHFADNTFKHIFMNKNVIILINISLKFVPKGLINNVPALVQIKAWCRPGDKPLSKPMMVNLLMHICVTRPQWVNPLCWWYNVVPFLHFWFSPNLHNSHPIWISKCTPNVSVGWTYSFKTWFSVVRAWISNNIP